MVHTTRVTLYFPRSWQVELPDHAAQVRERTRGWLRDRGVLRCEADEERFERLAVAEYANWPFPTASVDVAFLITRFLALWIFYDDHIEEVDDGQSERVFDAIAGRAGFDVGDDLFLRCWWELGAECAAVMSEAWTDRHAARFRDWARSVREESAAVARIRDTALLPPASEHLRRRAANIGMAPNLDFVELVLAVELGVEHLADPDFAAAVEASSEVVAIVNDLFGYAKDRRGRWANLVACVQAEASVEAEEAFARVATMLHDRVDTYAQREAALLGRHPELTAWAEGVRHVMYGFARWHAMAPRYDARPAVGPDRAVYLHIG